MSALGVLMQATLGGEPLSLRALNVIGMAVGLNLNLNYEPTIPFKGASLSGSGVGVAGFTSGVSIPKALLAVVVPAAVSFVEPFWLITDGERPLDFGSCELSGSFSSGSSSSGLGGSGPENNSQDTSTGHGRQGNRPLDAPHDHRDDEISGDNGGDDGNGDTGNNNPNLTPPPTNSMQGAPDISSPPRPIPGGAPPPPPPPPPGLGALWDENMDNLNTESFIQISLIILAGLLLQTLFDAMHRVLKSFSWYRASLKAFASFVRRMRRAARFRYMRSVLASGYKNSGKIRSVSFSVHKSVSRAAIKDKIVVEDLPKMKPIADKSKLRERPISVKPVASNPVADESLVFISAPVGPLANEPLADMFVKPTSPRDSVLAVLFKAFVDMIFRIYSLVHGFFALSYTTTIFLVTVIGLFAYYHMLIQAVGIVHLGPAVDAEKFLASLEARRNAKRPVVESVPVEVEEFITESITKEDDIPEGIYASMHSPVHALEDPSPCTSAEPAQQVEHQGGVPITELEFRQGYRTRRRTRCRKKKGPSSEVAPVAVEPSPLFVDEDSRSLSSSMWAA